MGAPAAVYVDSTAWLKKGSTRPEMAEIGPTSLDLAVLMRRILAEERALESMLRRRCPRHDASPSEGVAPTGTTRPLRAHSARSPARRCRC
jgi:hypothetical protein